MKTRIKEVTYGNEKKIFIVQSKSDLFSLKQDAKISFQDKPLEFILLFPLFLIFCLLSFFLWTHESDFFTLEEAKEYIDELNENKRLHYEKKKKEKLAKKVVSKKYIKYP